MPPDARPRVLHVITDLDVGGAETMLYNLVRATEGIEHRVLSLSAVGEIGSWMAELGVEVDGVGMRKAAADAGRFPRLVSRIRAAHPDVVHTWMIHANLAGGMAARAAGSSLLVWALHHTTLEVAHSPRTTIAADRLSARLSSRVPTRIVSCTRSGMRGHVEAGYDEHKMTFIPNGVDTSRFRPDPTARAALREELGVPATTPLVGMVARWGAQKDHPTFLDAARILAQARTDLHFVLAGRGTDEHAHVLARYTDVLGGRLHTLGPRSDVERLTAALDVSCLSSAYGEAAPMVMLEAMASGVPCVATDLGDCRDIVSSHGIIVPPRDPQRLAGAVAEVTDDRATYADGAREHVSRRFSLEATAAAYTDLYQDLLKPR